MGDVNCLPCQYLDQVWALEPVLMMLGMVVCACNLRTGETGDSDLLANQQSALS